eukprot:5346612-Pyramimonas_sp.AAC.1
MLEVLTLRASPLAHPGTSPRGRAGEGTGGCGGAAAAIAGGGVRCRDVGDPAGGGAGAAAGASVPLG